MKWLQRLAETDPKSFAALLARLVPAEVRAAVDLEQRGPTVLKIITGIDSGPCYPGYFAASDGVKGVLPAVSVESEADRASDGRADDEVEEFELS